MELMTYDAQVSFARRWLKEGRVQEAGIWRHGPAWGRLWTGAMGRWRITFETIGDGPYMRAGSFWVRYETAQ